MIAYKYETEQQPTVLNDVRWQVGKGGNLTPVGELEPVFIGGVTVTNVTLHNIDQIQRLDLHLGDTIVVERAGEVIPYVVEAVPGEAAERGQGRSSRRPSARPADRKSSRKPIRRTSAASIRPAPPSSRSVSAGSAAAARWTSKAWATCSSISLSSASWSTTFADLYALKADDIAELVGSRAERQDRDPHGRREGRQEGRRQHRPEPPAAADAAARRAGHPARRQPRGVCAGDAFRQPRLRWRLPRRKH